MLQLCCDVNHWYETRGIASNNFSDNFYQYANRIMVLLSLHNVDLPTAFGTIDTKIKTLLLNGEQRQAIETALDSKKAIIRGFNLIFNFILYCMTILQHQDFAVLYLSSENSEIKISLMSFLVRISL